MDTTISQAAVVLFIALLTYYLALHPQKSALSSFPGPYRYRISPIPYYISTLRGTSHTHLLDLHRKHGPIIRITPNQLSYATTSAWTDIWSHRPEFTKPIPPPVNGVQGILGASSGNHRKYRRAFAYAFSAQGLREQQPMIDRYIGLLMEGLEKYGTVDLVQWFQWTTFDLIGDLAFGADFGCLENARTHPWIADISGNLVSSVWLIAAGALGVLGVVRPFMPGRLKRAREENWRFVVERVATRCRMGSDRGDFFDRIVASRDSERGMTIEEMESNASNLVLAGSETSATMLSGTTALLLLHPEYLAKLTKDLRETFASVSDITIEACAKNLLLLAVLNESMRLYPPVPNFAGRRVPNPGDTVGGKYLPGGTMIQFNHVAAYRLEYNFADPDAFAPERWLGDPRYASDKRDVFQPFAVGPRDCLGKNLAYAETRLVIARLLWSFDFSVPGEQQDLGEWFECQKTFVMWQKPPLLVEVKRRAT